MSENGGFRTLMLGALAALVVPLVCVASAPVAFAAPPDNDGFGAATVIDRWSGVIWRGTTIDATKQPGEPTHAGTAGGSSIWYRWTARVDGPVTVQAQMLDPVEFSFERHALAVYTGGSVGSLRPVASGLARETRVEFDADAGTTYRIALDRAASSAPGETFLDLRAAADNDDFANATRLAGADLPFIEGDSFGATKEPGEPDHAGDRGGASVWFSWKAPYDSVVHLTSEVSDQSLVVESMLAAYTGRSVSTLTQVAADGPATFPEITFRATRGTRYSIAVDDSFDLGSGIVMSLQATPRGCTLSGTAAADILVGTAGPDTICGRDGNDVLRGRGGRDTIVGGSGRDTLFGLRARDRLFGSTGRDSLTGGRATDSCDGGPDTDSASTCERLTAVP